MGRIDYLLITGIVLVIGAIVCFIVRSKKKGKKCIGCPDSGTCGGNCGSCSCGCGSKD